MFSKFPSPSVASPMGCPMGQPMGVQSPPQGKDVLLMIRQGVAKQDRQAVKNALQLAFQLQTQIETPILDMLKKWLGEDAFNAAMGKAPPVAPPVVPPRPPAPAVAKPPLVLIREGVASQNKEAVRSALRTAVEQNTEIDAPVLEMLRKWLGQDDDALIELASRKGIQLEAKEEAVAQSTGKAVGAVPSTVPPRAAANLGGTVPEEAKAKAPGPVVVRPPPKAVPPRAKAVPQPVIRRGPVLKNEPPPPDLDASFDAFLQELDTSGSPVEELPENIENEPKRRKVEEEEAPSANTSKEEEPAKPEVAPTSPQKPPKRPPMRKPPEPKVTKDEWGRDVVPEANEQEKEAWQYLQEARAAAKTSVWGAGNFMDFDNFK